MGDSITTDGILLRFSAPEGDRAIVLDDDGKVAYAYLLVHDEVVSDVWLYNVERTPDAVNWMDRSAMPFLNPTKFCNISETMPRLTDNSDVQCIWYDQGVEIVVDGVPVARLENGARPGWSRLASRAGPLAKPLEIKKD